MRVLLWSAPVCPHLYLPLSPRLPRYLPTANISTSFRLVPTNIAARLIHLDFVSRPRSTPPCHPLPLLRHTLQMLRRRFLKNISLFEMDVIERVFEGIGGKCKRRTFSGKTTLWLGPRGDRPSTLNFSPEEAGARGERALNM